MNGRAIRPEDTIPIINIHKEYYASQFALPELMSDKNLVIYVVPNEQDKPITVGIIKLIPELIFLTDYSQPKLVRKDALISALAIADYTAKMNGFDQLHAFVHDPSWASIMKKKAGFAPVEGEALILNVRE